MHSEAGHLLGLVDSEAGRLLAPPPGESLQSAEVRLRDHLDYKKAVVTTAERTRSFWTLRELLQPLL